MTAYVALLRAVNLAGHNRVAMPDLLGVLADLGFAGGQSLLQSGNLVFQSDSRSADELEWLLERETVRRLGLRTDYLVRSAAEWRTIIDRNPFPEEAARDPSHLLVVALKKAPDEHGVAALQAAIQGPEYLRAEGAQLYVVYPAGIGRSKLTTTVIERTLNAQGTGRNWNTVLKLAERLDV